MTRIFSDDLQKFSYRFTSQRSAAVNEVQCHVGLFGVSIVLRASLQSDSSGLPSGVPLNGGGSFSVVDGWNDVSFSGAANLVAGNIYHLVLERDPSSSSLSPANNLNVDYGADLPDQIYPLSQVYDGQMACLRNDGTGWTVDPVKPIFLINYGGVWDGNPYAIGGNGARVRGSEFHGERFQVTTPLTVSSVGALVVRFDYPFSAPLSADLDWAVRDLGSGVTLAGGLLTTASAAPLTFAWVDVPTAFTLPPGAYRFELSSPGASQSAHSSFYYWDKGSPVSVSGIYPGLTYGGTLAYAEESMDGGLNWGPFGGSPSDDHTFRFGTSCSPTPTPSWTPAAPVCSDLLFASRNLYHPKTDNPQFYLRTNLCTPGPYSLRIYNSAGEFVRELRGLSHSPAGQEQVSWDGKNSSGDEVASGLYIIRLATSSSVKTAKVIVVH